MRGRGGRGGCAHGAGGEKQRNGGGGEGGCTVSTVPISNPEHGGGGGLMGWCHATGEGRERVVSHPDRQPVP
jgi:hypothetical protein